MLATQHYTLIYPIYRFPVDQIFVLLGLQKSGKWEGYINGFGGRVQDPEGYHACARRELREETGLIAEEGDLTFSGKIRCSHVTDDFPPVSVYIYLYEKWDGKYPKGGELERNFGNFSHNQLPFDKMPPDDQIWLPSILKGKCVDAKLTYETRREAVLLKTVEFNNTFPKPHYF